MRRSVTATCLAALGLVIAPVGVKAEPSVPSIIHHRAMIGSDTNRNDGFGAAISVSGRTMVVGAPGRNHQTGAAYVFVKTPSGWSQEAKLTALNAAPDALYGQAVAISRNTIVVGAQGAGGDLRGTAYIYQRTGTTWTATAELLDPAGADGDQFGIAVTAASHVIVVGAPGTDSDRGAAYVYKLNAGKWVLRKTLRASDAAANAQFGISVATAGGTVAVGAPGAASNLGNAYLYAGASWTQFQEISDPNPLPTHTQFGDQVAFDPAGQNLVIGATGEDAGYVFFGSPGTPWENYARLANANATINDGYATTLAITPTEILIGAPYHATGAGSNVGVVYPWINDATTWDSQPEVVDPPDTARDQFGVAVGLMGHTALIGAPGDTHFTGVVYRFTGGPF